MLEQELGVLPGANRKLLNVSGLPAGAYVLKVSIGGQYPAEQFVVDRH